MGIILQLVLPILIVVGLYLAIYIRLSDRPPVSSNSLTSIVEILGISRLLKVPF